jgi:pSer/pThr/pTyr-binding forkhead associated (FHA) protein
MAEEQDRPSGQAFAPTVVNGVPALGEIWLADGDTILIASRTLQFHERMASKAAAAPAEGEQPVANMPQTPEPSQMIQAVPPAEFAPAEEPVARKAKTRPPAAPAPSDLAGTRLSCLEGPYAAESFSLKGRSTTVGRGSDRDVALEKDDALSRYQLTITYKDGRHAIRDEDSANGTFVNEERLVPGEPKVLKAGDYIRAGRTIMKYE